MAKKQEKLVHDVIVDHELHGVTPEMIEWWFVNKDKGYPLWHPDDHKSFAWEIPPSKVGRIGSIELAEEKIGNGPVSVRRIRGADPKEVVNLPAVYEHVAVTGWPDADGKIRTFLTHQFEATSYGTRMRSIRHNEEGMPGEAAEAFIKHCKEEMGRLPDFLPELYKMWKVVTDPKMNVHPISMEVKKLPDGRWGYTAQSGS